MNAEERIEGEGAMTHAEVAAVLEEYGRDVDEITVEDWLDTFGASVWWNIKMFGYLLLITIFMITLYWDPHDFVQKDGFGFLSGLVLSLFSIFVVGAFWGTFQKEFVTEEPDEYPVVHRMYQRRLIFWRDLANATWPAKPLVMFNILLRWALVLVLLAYMVALAVTWYQCLTVWS